MDEWIRVVGGVAYFFVLLGFAAFCLLFHVLAEWKASVMGRHIMAFMLVCTGILSWGFLNYVVDIHDTIQAYMRIPIYAALGWVAWWRVKILIDTQIRDRERSHPAEVLEGKSQDDS